MEGSFAAGAAAGGRTSFARAAGLMYATNLAASVLSLANVLVVARALGAEGRGSVAFLTAMAWLTSNLAMFGVHEANANFAAAQPGLRRALATNSVLLSVFLGGASLAFLAGVIEVFPAVGGEADANLRWLTLSFLPVLILQAFVRWLVQADYGFAVTNLAFLLGPVINLAVNGVLAAVGVLTVGTAVSTWIAGQTLGTLLMVWYVARRLAGFGRPDLGLARRTLVFGVKTHAGRIMLIGNYRLDQWLVGAIAGSRELGLYSVAVAWAEALWQLPTVVAAVQRPDLVRAGRRAAGALAAAVFRAATLVTAAGAVAMVLAAPFLCVDIFGAEFADSVGGLRVLALGAFGVVALKLFGNALVAQGRPVLQSVAIGAGFACTVLLDLILIPPFGALGAAVASTLAYTAAGVVIAVVFLRALEGSPRDLLPRVGDVVSFARVMSRRLRPSHAPRAEPAPAERAEGEPSATEELGVDVMACQPWEGGPAGHHQHTRRTGVVAARIISPAVAAFVGGLAAFAMLGEEARNRHKVALDDFLYRVVHGLDRPDFDPAVLLISRATGGFAIAAIAMLAALWLWIRRRRAEAVFLLTSVLVPIVLTIELKDVFARPRPYLGPDPEFAPASYSFPSSHAVASFAICAAVVSLAWRTRWRWPVVGGAAFVALVVGFSLLYLGVDYPSDVVGGWSLALAWTSLLATVYHVAATTRRAPRLRPVGERRARPPVSGRGVGPRRQRSWRGRPRPGGWRSRPPVPTTDRALLLEPNLLLSFAQLGERLLRQAQTLAAADRAGRERQECLLDCFLLTAGLHQIVEDHLHRDFVGLERATRHLRRLPRIGRVAGTASRALAAAGSRLRTSRRGERRARELAGAVAALAERLATHVVDGAGGPSNGDAKSLAREAQELVDAVRRAPRALRCGIQRPPNCFGSFDQHPRDCVALADRFAAEHPNRARAVLVLGLRTSGSYLAPLYAAALKDRGYREVQWLTVRGAGRLRRNEARLLDDVVVDDGLVLLVDDPPRSGQQLAEVAGEVGRRGVALASTILVLQVVGGEDSLPAALRRYPAVVLAGEDWEIIRAASPARLRETLAPMLGTAPGLLDVEIVQRATPERGHLGMLLSVRLTDPPIGRQASLLIYAEGAGLGYFGRRALAVADAVKDFVPGVIGFRDGLVFREWLPQERRLTASQVRTAPEMVAGEIARYVHARSERLPVERDTTLLLERGEPAWEVVAVMLGHAFGSARQFVRVLARAAAKRLLTARRPAVVDADTAPWQWFADEGGGTRLRKIGFHQQTFANTAAACCDPVSDLAGAAAAAEAEEIGTLAPLLRTEYERLSGETIGDERWFLYRLHHHYRAYQRSLREAARGEGRDAAFTRALSLERTMARIHRDYFEQLYLADVEPATDGPFCALDLDGVIETRWLGYSAIAPAGALALRVLHRHGYRIVLATGRSLDEARERCHAYRLVGAVAEYGSVVYDPATDGARGLLSEADVARLEAVRKALEEMPGVFVDPVYRHSIRAHTVGGEGRPLGLRADLIAEALAAAGVENRIHAVSGHGQTDFVAGSVDKGRGLAVLLSQLEAPPHVEFAVGDGASDLAMFELAKRALAPASATADVSGRAEIVSQPYQAGLLDAVARVLGHRLGACAACRPTGPPSPEARLLLAALGALDGGKRAKARAAVALALRAREPGRPRRRSPARLRIDARPADDRGAGD